MIKQTRAKTPPKANHKKKHKRGEWSGVIIIRGGEGSSKSGENQSASITHTLAQWVRNGEGESARGRGHRAMSACTVLRTA